MQKVWTDPQFMIQNAKLEAPVYHEAKSKTKRSKAKPEERLQVNKASSHFPEALWTSALGLHFHVISKVLFCGQGVYLTTPQALASLSWVEQPSPLSIPQARSCSPGAQGYRLLGPGQLDCTGKSIGVGVEAQTGTCKQGCNFLAKVPGCSWSGK